MNLHIIRKQVNIYCLVFQIIHVVPDSALEFHYYLLGSTLQSNAEADSFACFVRLLSDSVDHFCQQLDNSSVGILSTLSRLAELLEANDKELWRHLEISTKVTK